MKILSYTLIPLTMLLCACQINQHSGHVEILTQNKSETYRKISDEKAIDLAIKAVKKKKLFGGSIIQYDETEVKEYGDNLKVTFIKYLPAHVLGSTKVYSVELDAHSGKFISFLGY